MRLTSSEEEDVDGDEGDLGIDGSEAGVLDVETNGDTDSADNELADEHAKSTVDLIGDD